MKAIILLLAVLGMTAALQAPVEYEYQYEARVGSGVQSARPQYSGTGIRAKVKVSVKDQNTADFTVTSVEVGEKNQVLGDDGREPLSIQFQGIKDKAIQQPFTAHLRQKEGETVLEVPQSDLLWVTNVRRGIANFFRIAPLTDPSSVRPSQSGSVDSQAFSRMEDTYAGRCRVEYSVTKASEYDIPSSPSEDIQSQKAPKGPGGRQIQLEEVFYRVQTSLDFSTCKDRVALLQTGSANLTNVTDSDYRDVTVRSHVNQYILKGAPGTFRMESGEGESQFVLEPFGVESDNMVVISNQTMRLLSARPMAGGVQRVQGATKQIKTWSHQVQSPNQKPSGYSPRWIQYNKDSEASPRPIFYERLSSGFGYTQTFKNAMKDRVKQAVQRAAQQLQVQNKDSTAEPKDYSGTEDGRAVQSLLEAHKIVRALPKDVLQQIDQDLKQQEKTCQLCHDLYIEALAVAGSGPSLDLLMDKIQGNQLSENRTASIFFSLANNIQSPEAVDKILNFVMSLQEEQRVTVSLLAKNNIGNLIRRVCVGKEEMSYSHMSYLFGDKGCNRQQIVPKYVSHLKSKIQSSGAMWVKLLNVIALSDLGAQEGLDTLQQVARGEISSDRFLRYAAIHGLSINTFDNSSRDQIFNILQPIAESHVEDYRVRQIAYDTMLAWRPNVTFIQRMAFLSRKEPSVQIQSYIYYVIDSLAAIEDPMFRPLSNAARNLRPFTRYMNPSLHRAATIQGSRYLPKEQVGAYGEVAWLTGLRTYFPNELYGNLVASLGRFEVPFIESILYGNTDTAYSYTRDILSSMRRVPSIMSAERQQRRSRIQQQMRKLESGGEQRADLYFYARVFKTSEIFLPLTNELYTHIEAHGNRMVKQFSSNVRGGSDDRSLVYKYFNPVEVNVILPTPVGLFALTEVSTPTVVYVDVKTEAKLSPRMEGSSELPKLSQIDVSAEGIVKAITKVNTYSYVFAPWTNKTVVAAIDNEKSVSLPMKVRLAADVRLPVQQLWGQITPKFNQSSSPIPVIKVRNVPFTGIGKTLLSPVHSGDYESLKKVQWVYSESDQQNRETIPISADATGLNAEIKYVGEPESPFHQPNLIDYIREPSRLMTLISSPSVKNYEITLYQKPGGNPNKNIGFSLRHTLKKGSGSSSIQVPSSAKQPIDVSAEDTIEQRQQKVAQFSSQNNHEFSARINFTGSDTKIYEAVAIGAEQERIENQEQVKRSFYKVQVALLQKNSKSQSKPKTCFVAAIDRPQMIPMATKQEVRNSQQQQWLRSTIGGSVYEGSSCGSSQQPLGHGQADLTVSDSRVQSIMSIDDKGDFSYSNTSEFFRLAVYDQMKLTYDWTTPSDQLRNMTLRAKDLLEGYMFPSILKNRMVTNHANRMVVKADRSVSDDRIDVWVELPKETVHGERLRAQPWFDYLTGFTSNVFSVYSGGKGKLMSSAGDQCYVSAAQVKTFDGVNYKKLPTACETTVLRIARGKDDIAVYTKQTPQSSSQQQFIRILSAEDGLEIVIQGNSVKINGQEQQEKIHQQKDESGNVLAKIMKFDSGIKVDILQKMVVFAKHSAEHMLIKLDSRFTNATKGLCGDFDSQAVNDLADPKGCIYAPSRGLEYASSWVKSKSQCQEAPMKHLFQQTQQFQQSCQPRGRALSAPSPSNCQVHAYPIITTDTHVCVATEKTLICGGECKPEKVTVIRQHANCWRKNHVPKVVTDALESPGYLTEIPDNRPDNGGIMDWPVPTKCVPLSARHMTQLTDDHKDCYTTGYPVSQEGPLLCVGTQPIPVCKSECRVGDTLPQEMQGKCWNYPEAPQSVQSALRTGYVTSAVSQSAPFQQTLAVQAPRFCYKRA